MSSREQMRRVADLSFVQGKNNTQIARILRPDKPVTKTTNISWVQDSIDEAGQWLLSREKRLAKLEEPTVLERDLAFHLCKKFDILDARVISVDKSYTPAEYGDLLRLYGRAGADYFDEVSSRAEDKGEELHVGISGGHTVLDCVGSLPRRKRGKTYFYTTALIGRGGRKHATHVGPEANATIAWSRSGRLPAHIFYGTVPPYKIKLRELSEETKEQRHKMAREMLLAQVEDLKKADEIRDVLDDMYENINFAIAGLGIVRTTGFDKAREDADMAGMTITGLLRPLGIDTGLLAKEGAIGELSYNFFNCKGEGDPRWHFFLTAGDNSKCPGLSFYRHLVEDGRKVMVMAGIGKDSVIVPAIKARLFNVLITDSATASQLLKA